MPLTNVGSLIGELGLDTSGFQQGLTRASGQLNNQLKNFERRTRITGDRLNAIGKNMALRVTLPVIAATGALGAMVLRLGNFASELLGLRAAFGVSLEFLQGLRGVAAEAGTDFDVFRRMFQRISDLLRGVTSEDEVPEIFKRLGINVFDATGELRPMQEIFLEVIDALNQIENPLERAALGSELFGEDWAQIAPIIALGRDRIEEIIEATDKLPESAILAADRTRESWQKVRDEFDLLLMTLASQFLPFIEDTLLPFLEDQFVPFIEDKFIPALERLNKEWGKLTSPIQLAIAAFLVFLAISPILLLVLGQLFAAVAALNTVLMFLVANPLVLIVGGLLLLFATLLLIRTFWEEVTGFIEERTGIFAEVIIGFLLLIMAMLQGIIPTLKLLRDTWRELWDDMLAFFSDVIVAGFKNRINAIIDMINHVINMWNRLSFRVPRIEVFPGRFFGGQRIGVPRIELIPSLAAGGIVTEPTLALIGEAGPEAVVPLGSMEAMGGQILVTGNNIFGFDDFARHVGRAGGQVIRGGGWPRLMRS